MQLLSVDGGKKRRDRCNLETNARQTRNHDLFTKYTERLLSGKFHKPTLFEGNFNLLPAAATSVSFLIRSSQGFFLY